MSEKEGVKGEEEEGERNQLICPGEKQMNHSWYTYPYLFIQYLLIDTLLMTPKLLHFLTHSSYRRDPGACALSETTTKLVCHYFHLVLFVLKLCFNIFFTVCMYQVV